MDDVSDKAREKLIDELDNIEWDISDEGLEHVAGKLKGFFPSVDDARDFVEEQASDLYRIMMEDMES